MNYKSRFVWKQRTGLRSETAVQFIKFAIMREAFLGGRKTQKHEVGADDLVMESQKMTETANIPKHLKGKRKTL